MTTAISGNKSTIDKGETKLTVAMNSNAVNAGDARGRYETTAARWRWPAAMGPLRGRKLAGSSAVSCGQEPRPHRQSALRWPPPTRRLYYIRSFITDDGALLPAPNCLIPDLILSSRMRKERGGEGERGRRDSYGILGYAARLFEECQRAIDVV